MQVKEIMTKEPTCCAPDTKLQEVARMMLEHDCGEIPVVDGRVSKALVGVVTDRDITCRAVAKGKNPLEMTAADCMTSPATAVTPETSLEDCCKLMERMQIRRVPVVDKAGDCCGIVAQADIAKHSPQEAAELVAGISA
ncbi:MAG TPA: CBS domain-containing protein [Acidobacteriota bacterium]|jgi:CBS domain-containing protein|nr:CBS domain-containing protein [Acidobacteriota bacterium]